MRPRNIRAAHHAARIHHFAHAAQGGQAPRPTVRDGGGQQRGRAVLRVQAGQLPYSGGAVHRVAARAAVNVGVYESGQEVALLCAFPSAELHLHNLLKALSKLNPARPQTAGQHQQTAEVGHAAPEQSSPR